MCRLPGRLSDSVRPAWPHPFLEPTRDYRVEAGRSNSSGAGGSRGCPTLTLPASGTAIPALPFSAGLARPSLRLFCAAGGGPWEAGAVKVVSARLGRAAAGGLPPGLGVRRGRCGEPPAAVGGG